MAELAIKGHQSRGNEVIELLEMLGGKNSTKLVGNASSCGYYIDSDGNIAYHYYSSSYFFNDTIQFILEEFLEKYPYKVGDMVIYNKKVFNIVEMMWNKNLNTISYGLYNGKRKELATIKELQPYKEETMEDKDTISPTTEINLNHPCFKGNDEIELIIPKGWKFEQRNDKMFGVRKQYPKTYEEICEILNIPSNGNVAYVGNWVYGGEYLEKHLDRLRKFQQLLICRDAYWKLAGEQMELGKPWKQDYNDRCFIITNNKGNIHTYEYHGSDNVILAFPTAEIRDTFYENFKGLIEQCKELL